MSLASRIFGFFTPKKRSRTEDVEHDGGKRGRVLFDELPQGVAGQSKSFDTVTGHSTSTFDLTIQDGKTLLESVLAPRPFALIVTSDFGTKTVTLRPCSSFSWVPSVQPNLPAPFISIGIASAAYEGSFTLNIFTEEFAQTAVQAAGIYKEPADIPGLTLTAPVQGDNGPPRICEATVSLQCDVRSAGQVLQSSETGTTDKVVVNVLLAEVTGVHILKDMVSENADGQSVLDFDKYRPVSHMGGNLYSRNMETFQLTAAKKASSAAAPKGAKQPDIPEEAVHPETLVEADAPAQPATPEEAENAAHEEGDAAALAVASDIDAAALEALKNVLPTDVEVPMLGKQTL